MRRASFVFLWIACLCLLVMPAVQAAKALEIYFIDVEGGQSTLIVDPEGESLLVDTGWDDFNRRDANRILAAAKDAGIDHIDDLVITHYHSDHVGGIAQLASRIKIDAFFDHGPNIENDTRGNYATYEKIAAQSRRRVVKPGDEIPLKGIRVQVLTSAGKDITQPLPGAGQPNPLCASEPKALPDPGENAQSVGMLITFGKFRFLDLGDLTNQKELGLVCPSNLIGVVDLYLVTHHGTAHPGTGDSSNAPAIVYALHPRVAVMNNGAIKGGHPVTWQTIHDSPGIEGFWQLHYSMAGAEKHNVPERFIANVGGNDEGYFIKASAEPNADFTVTNERNGYSVTYTK
jgi:competence protein ComEC